MNRLVNEQTEVALLLAVPGILGMLTFAPWIIKALYSSKFESTVGILRWQLCGIFGRVIVWPMIYVLYAKGYVKTIIWTEFVASLVHIVFNLVRHTVVWCGWLGVAFFCLYIFYVVLMLAVLDRVSRFCWTQVNLKLMSAASLLIASVFLATSGKLQPRLGLIIGSLTSGVAAWYAIRTLAHRAGYVSVRDALLAPSQGFQESKVNYRN